MWYYTRAGEQQGPVEFAALQQMAAGGMLTPQDLVWNEGMPQWASAATIAGLFGAAGESQRQSPFPTAPSEVPLGYYSPQSQPAGYAGYAGFWLRFVAYIVDSIVCFVAGLLIGAVIGAIFGAMGAMRSKEGALTLQVVAQLTGIAVVWLYYALQESSAAQATLGKRMLSLRVTDLNGNRISFGRATGRYFGKYISAIILCIGFMMAGFTERKQALHDQMAGTLVFRTA